MFSDLLKELRADKGVTQIDLARAIGVSNGNVGDWERGRSKPGYDALVALSLFFEISPGKLLGIEEKPTDSGLNLDSYKSEQGLTCDGSPLSEAETDLIAMFRLLPPSHQEELFDLTYFKYKRHVEEKRESIYSTYLDTGANKESGHALDRIQDATA